MKKFSKLFWVALVVVVTLVVSTIGVFAAETSTAVIYAESYEVTETQTEFSVDFKFKENNTPVECGKITLTWDPTKLAVKSIKAAGELEGVPFGTKFEGGEAVIAWAGSEITKDMDTGELFTVGFENKGIDEDSCAFVDVAVDNFGYTKGIVQTELKGSVTTKRFLADGAGDNEFTFEEDDPKTVLEDAFEAAAEGKEATVILKSDMIFDESHTEIGSKTDVADWAKDAEGNVLGKIIIKSDPENTATKYSIILNNNAVVVMYGHYEFSDMILKGSHSDKDNCLVFPDDSSAVFGTGLVGGDEGTSNKWLSIAGNVTVNSGEYYFIAGNCKGSNVEIAKPYNITMQGGAIANYVAGGMINGTGTGKVSNKANVRILDEALLYQDVCASGRYTGNDGTAGADVLICTTKKVPNVYAIVGTVSKASTFDIRIANVVDANVASALISGKTGVGGAETTINWHLDGGTIKDFNGGLKITGTNTNESYIDGAINIYVNKREATLPTGCEYAALSTIPTFCAGSAVLNGATKVEDRADRTLEVYAGTTISGVLYGGSKLSTADSAHEGDTEITIYGGTFSNAVYGGSFTTAAGIHSGDVELNIHGGTFTSTTGIYGGSLLNASGSSHNGKVTLTIQPGNGAQCSFTGYVMGGSRTGSTGAGAEHKGETIVYLKDVNTRGENTQTESQQTLFASGTKIGGGSQVSTGATHSGNSQLIIQRCNMGGDCWIFGGSYLSGASSEHSGTSNLTIDGNTPLNESTKGYNNLYENATEGWFGGSYLTGASAKQTGESGVEIIGTEDEDTSDAYEMTQIRGGDKVGIYGGCYYASASVTLPQQNNSYVKITGTVYTGNANINTGKTGVYAVGGSRYSTQKFTYAADDFVPSSRVIIEGDFTGRVIGGFRTEKSVTNTSYKHNSGVTLKRGSLSAWVCSGSDTNDGNWLGTGCKQEGLALLEIYGSFCSDNGTISLYSNGGASNRLSANIYGVKLIGEFNDGDDADEVFRLNLVPNGSYDIPMHYLDLVQATGDSIEIYKSTTATTTQTATEGIISSVDGKNIYFGLSNATHSDDKKLPATEQYEVNPDMTFDELLRETGLKISNESTGEDATGNTLLDYTLYTRFDRLSSSPNAFEFYAAGEDGEATGDPLTQIPADPSQQIVVKIGNTESAPTYLRHVFRMSGANLLLESDFSIIVKFKATLKDFYEEITLVGTDKNGNETVIKVNTEGEDGSCSFVYKNVAAHTLGDDIQFKLRAKFGEEVAETAVTPYSVKRYCDRQLSSLDTKTALSTLLVDILNYGAAAQKYMYPDTEVVLVNATLTDAQKAFGTEISVLDGVKSVFSQDPFEEATVIWTGAALIPEEKIKIRAKIRPNDMSIDPATLKVGVVVGGGEMKYIDGSSFELMPATEGEGYYVYFDDLEPNQLRDTIDLTVYDLAGNRLSQTAHYSVESYVFTKKNDSNEALVNLCDEMLQYGDAHYDYVEYLKENNLL